MNIMLRKMEAEAGTAGVALEGRNMAEAQVNLEICDSVFIWIIKFGGKLKC